MSRRGGYQGRNYDENYRKRGRGRGRNSNPRSFQPNRFPPQRNSQSDGISTNPVNSNAIQSPPTGNRSEKQVNPVPVAGAGAFKRKGRKSPRKKNNPPGNAKPKLGQQTNLVLNIKTVDYRHSCTNYFSPPFGPLQEVYHYLIPRMRQYFNDYIRSQSVEMINYSFEFFYQSFAFRVAELYLSKIWLFAAPERFLSAHYDQIKAILNSTQPLIKEMIHDVSNFIGNFELAGEYWQNKFPLLVVSHHWLQAAYGYASAEPFEHDNSGVGLASTVMSSLPIMITHVGEHWPFPPAMLDDLGDGEGLDLLRSRNRDDDIALSLFLQDWQANNSPNPVAINDITLYLFNGMINPDKKKIHAWMRIPTNRNNNAFDYHVGEGSDRDVHPTLEQVVDDDITRPCLTRFFPWRESHRSKSPFIIQFNCEFLRDNYNDKMSREGIEALSMPLAATLLQLIGSEIDTWMDYHGAWFIVPAQPPVPDHLTFRKRFALRTPRGFNHSIVNKITAGEIRVEYYDAANKIKRVALPMRLRYKLPLWWHAYEDFNALNEMEGFLNPDNDIDDEGEFVNEYLYDIERHWWKWCMAGVYPRWQPYRYIVEHVECHWGAARTAVQLDFLRQEVPVTNYRAPDFSGSSLQLSRIFKSEHSENIRHLEKNTDGELAIAFIITDRANWIWPTVLSPVTKRFCWLTHFEGIDQVRRIKDTIASFFPQSAWTISNQK